MANESKTPAPLSAEERQSRYDELRRRAATSRIFAEARDKSLAVRWVRQHDATDISYHQWLGFSFAKEPDPKASRDKRLYNTAIEPDPDGCYRLGDVILMVINKDDYDFYCNENVELSRKMVDNGKKSFRDDARKLDVPTFERDQHGRIVG
jgi:hypothetical protein